MHAIEVAAYGGPEVLVPVTRDDPQPGPGQLLVDVAATGVNFIETYQRSGRYQVPLPFIPGAEGAGVVTAIGHGVTDFAVGDRVCWVDQPGSYASRIVIAAARAVPVPDAVADEVAASALLQGLTAHYLLDGSAHPQPGDPVLIHAGAGGVGLVLTQQAKAKGLQVITTVSTDAKAALSHAAGADHVLRYSADLPAQVKDLTGGRGVAVAYDGVGKDTFEQSLEATRVRGTVVLFGGASGQVPPFDLQRLNALGSLTVTRPSLGFFIADPAEFRWRTGEVIDAIAAGRTTVTIGGRYPLADAAAAHSALQSRRTTGSVVLVP